MANSVIESRYKVCNQYANKVYLNEGDRVTSGGLITFYLRAVDPWGYAEVQVNGVTIGIAQNATSDTHEVSYYGNLRVNVGDQITWNNANGGTTSVQFFPYI